MTNLFLQILNASITASWLIGAVVLVRLVIKRKAPRWIVCLLWGLVAVRLVLPFEVESSFSLVPDTPKITLEESIEVSAEPEVSLQAPPVEQLGNTFRPTEEISHDSTPEESIPEESTEESAPEESLPEASTEESVPEISTEESMEESIEESIEESTEESFEESMDTSTEASTEISAEESVPTVVGSVTNPPSAGDSGISTATVAGIVWLCGLVALAVYALVNYLLLKKQVAIFVPDNRGFRRCEAIDTPFVLGFFRPRIYLPYGLSSANEPYILAHEQAHIRRLDHLVKPVAYLVLAIHWFNPLVWLSFVLFCKDIEYACDEKVLKNAAADIRKDYASALLECASKRSFLAACPIAFGEVSVKERVKTTMSYKKPFLWVMILCIILCAVVAVLFCTSPADTEGTSSQEQSTENVLETSEDTESPGNEPAEMPDYAEFIPLRMQYLTMESEPELFYASRGEESWLYIPAWEQTVHLSSYILDERSSGALVEDEAVFVGTNANNGEPYALYARKGIGHVEKKKIGITDEAKSFTTFCDNTDTYSKFSVFVFATTEDEVIPYHCSIQNFTESWPVAYLPFLPTIPAGLTPVMADYVGAYYSGYIAFQPTTGNTGYFELYSSDHNSDGSRLVKWNHHATIVCPAYEGLISARPINIKRISRNSTKLAMTVRVDLENNEPQYVTFQGENSDWSPNYDMPSPSELPPETETTAELITRFDIGEDTAYLHPIYYYKGLEDEAWYSNERFYYTDGQGNYYYAQHRSLFRLSDGVMFPFVPEKQIVYVVFHEQKLYFMDIDDTIYVFDISEGFEDPTLLSQRSVYQNSLENSCYLYVQNDRVYAVRVEDKTKTYFFYDADSLEAVDPPFSYLQGISLPVEWKKDGTVILRKGNPYDGIHRAGQSILVLSENNGKTYYSPTSHWRETLYTVVDRDGAVVSRVKYVTEFHDEYLPCKMGYTVDGVQYFIKDYKPNTIRVNELVFEDVLSFSLNWQEDGSLCLLLIYPSYGEIYHIRPGVTHDGFTPVTDENGKKPEKPVLLRVEGLNLKDMDDLLSDSGIYDDQWSHEITSYHDTKCEGVYIRTDLLDLTKDFSVMETYLEGLGVSCQVTAITGLICDLAPFTLKIDTADGEPYFLLVKDNGDSYTYTLMTLDEYRASYQRVEGKLVVNGVEIDASPAPYIYGDTGHLPLIAIMEGLGAEVQWEDHVAVITLDGITLHVDKTYIGLWYIDKNGHEAEYPDCVDEIAVYFVDDHIMLHRAETERLFATLFPDIQIHIDGETDTVYVTK